MEATSITKWQLTESKNTTVEVSLFLLRIMIWPVLQTEGSESEVWAEKTCLLFIVACRHWESEQQETDQHEEESIAETASDDKICITWCGWTQIQTLETALGRIKTHLLGWAGGKKENTKRSVWRKKWRIRRNSKTKLLRGEDSPGPKLWTVSPGARQHWAEEKDWLATIYENAGKASERGKQYHLVLREWT